MRFTFKSYLAPDSVSHENGHIAGQNNNNNLGYETVKIRFDQNYVSQHSWSPRILNSSSRSIYFLWMRREQSIISCYIIHIQHILNDEDEKWIIWFLSLGCSSTNATSHNNIEQQVMIRKYDSIIFSTETRDHNNSNNNIIIIIMGSARYRWGQSQNRSRFMKLMRLNSQKSEPVFARTPFCKCKVGDPFIDSCRFYEPGRFERM